MQHYILAIVAAAFLVSTVAHGGSRGTRPAFSQIKEKKDKDEEKGKSSGKKDKKKKKEVH